MQTTLLWQLSEDPAQREGEVERVAKRLHGFTSTLFGRDPEIVKCALGGFGLIHHELPVEGWRAPRHVEERDEFALTIDFPVDLERAIAAGGAESGSPTDPPLLRLARALRERHEATVKELSPTFVLIHGDRKTDALHVWNDGLGYCQFLEYRDARHFALTNRPLALRALGIDLIPEPVEWAARALSGWFHLDRTGFRNLRAVAPGSHYTLSSSRVAHERVDAVRHWLKPLGLSQYDAIEYASGAVRDHLLAAAKHWDRAGVAFSAGRDSRAIIATMLWAGVKIDFLRTHGKPRNTEMLIARHLGQLLGVEHRLQFGRGLPPADERGLRRSFDKAVTWQLSLMENKAYKGFFRDRSHLGTGKVNIMGKHGELGRGYYYHRAERTSAGLENPEGALLEYFSGYDLDLLRQDIREGALDLLRSAIGQARGYGLERHQILDFFYLFERTRRWAAGTIYNQRDKVITPFLTPGYIQATFHLDAKTRRTNAVQSTIVERHAPQFADVPYLSDEGSRKWSRERLGKVRRMLSGTAEFVQSLFTSRDPPYVIGKGKRYAFDNTKYWQCVGKNWLDDALAHSPLVAAIYDRDALANRLPKEPDIVAVCASCEQAATMRLDLADPE